jgi:hypothetical protein
VFSKAGLCNSERFSKQQGSETEVKRLMQVCKTMKSEENINNNFVNSNDIELSLMDHSQVAQKTLQNSVQLNKPRRKISSLVQ